MSTRKGPTKKLRTLKKISAVYGNIRYANIYDAYGVPGMANKGSFGSTGQLNLP